MSIIIQGDREDIKLEGEKYIVTSPYLRPNLNNLYGVSVKPKNMNVKVKYVLLFANKARADVFKRGNVNVIKFHKFTLMVDGKLEAIYTSSQKDLDLYIEKMSVGFTKQDSDKDKDRIIRDVFGENMTEKDLFGQGMEDMADANVAEMLEAWEDYYQEKSEDATDKAKKLLISISEHYLNKDIISKDTYIRYKMVIQAESLSMLFSQLSLTKQVLMKFFKEIMSELGNKAVYEAFRDQQKFVLEINGFINKTIKEIIDDMKLAKDRHYEKAEEDAKEIEKAEAEIGNVSLITTRNRKNFLNELESLMEDVEGEMLENDYTEEDIEKLKRLRESELNIKNDDEN